MVNAQTGKPGRWRRYAEIENILLAGTFLSKMLKAAGTDSGSKSYRWL